MSTFEESDTVSQFPPVNENFPDPIRRRISSGVSFGPLANGVHLSHKMQILIQCTSHFKVPSQTQ